MYLQFIHRWSFTLQGEIPGHFFEGKSSSFLINSLPSIYHWPCLEEQTCSWKGCLQTQRQQSWELHSVHAASEPLPGSAGTCTDFYYTLSSSSLLVKLARSLPNESSICLICLSFSAILHKGETVTAQYRRCGWKHQAKPKIHPGPLVQLLLQTLLTAHFGSKSFSILNAVCLPKNL